MKFNKILPICVIAMVMSSCSSPLHNNTEEINSISVTTSLDTTTVLQTISEIPTEASTEEITETTTVEEAAETTVITIAATKYSPTAEEKAQIQSLLLESKKFFYGYISCKEISKHKSEKNFTTTTEIIDNGMDIGESYEAKWYEIVDGDVMSMTDLTDKMVLLFTDKMIDDIHTEINNYYYEENGKLYLSEDSGSDGGLLGIDTVHIISVGEVDENTLVLYMTAFGAGENWDIDYDITEDFTIMLKRTDNGFKIDECNFVARGYIEWCYIPEDDVF